MNGGPTNGSVVNAFLRNLFFPPGIAAPDCARAYIRTYVHTRFVYLTIARSPLPLLSSLLPFGPVKGSFFIGNLPHHSLP